MQSRIYRVGQIVPSSNTTMETEIPAMLNAHSLAHGTRFTFHSSRMRMKKVQKEELAAMDAESDRCAVELSDARVDVLGYACLVAIMSMGKSYHRISQERLHKKTVANDAPAPVVTSAGALVDALGVLGAKKIAVVAPYVKPLDSRALEIPDNLDVARHDPRRLPDIVAGMDYSDVDAIVLSACVQMPSLPVVSYVEAATRKPVVTAAISTTYAMLKALDLKTYVPGGGALLSGAF
ncbi:maleate isomerase [Bradyrhizobium diazoefficiens]